MTTTYTDFDDDRDTVIIARDDEPCAPVPLKPRAAAHTPPTPPRPTPRVGPRAAAPREARIASPILEPLGRWPESGLDRELDRELERQFPLPTHTLEGRAVTPPSPTDAGTFARPHGERSLKTIAALSLVIAGAVLSFVAQRIAGAGVVEAVLDGASSPTAPVITEPTRTPTAAPRTSTTSASPPEKTLEKLVEPAPKSRTEPSTGERGGAAPAELPKAIETAVRRGRYAEALRELSRTPSEHSNEWRARVRARWVSSVRAEANVDRRLDRIAELEAAFPGSSEAQLLARVARAEHEASKRKFVEVLARGGMPAELTLVDPRRREYLVRVEYRYSQEVGILALADEKLAGYRVFAEIGDAVAAARRSASLRMRNIELRTPRHTIELPIACALHVAGARARGADPSLGAEQACADVRATAR